MRNGELYKFKKIILYLPIVREGLGDSKEIIQSHTVVVRDQEWVS